MGLVVLTSLNRSVAPQFRRVDRSEMMTAAMVIRVRSREPVISIQCLEAPAGGLILIVMVWIPKCLPLLTPAEKRAPAVRKMLSVMESQVGQK